MSEALLESELFAALLDAVPELRSRLAQGRVESGCPLESPHLVFGPVLAPYTRVLLAEKSSDEVLRRIFAFMERMLADGDESVRWVARISFLTEFYEPPELSAMARRFMGPISMKISRDIEQYGTQGSGV